MEALREIFIAALLPDRKLRAFEEQPLGAVAAGSKEGARWLLLWHLEDQLKRRRAARAPRQHSFTGGSLQECLIVVQGPTLSDKFRLNH